MTCSLLGSLAEYEVSRDSEDGLQGEKRWEASTTVLEKVNAMCTNGSFVAVGGFGKDGKGVVEIWDDPLRNQ